MSPALEDRPRFDAAGDFRSVDGILRSLRLENASPADQRAAIARLRSLAGIPKLLEPLLPELRRRGLVD